MKNSCINTTAACVGAVIGAGFASGREIISFFTQYGIHSWWLLAVAVAVMTALCLLCAREVQRTGCDNWCDLFRNESKRLRAGVQWCSMLLMTLVGGAMVSAAGYMTALLWPQEWAYSVGAAVTLITAWRIGFGNLKPLGWLSGVLMLALIAVMVLLLRVPVQTPAVRLDHHSKGLLWAAFRAVGYAGMNMTLAIGMVCRSARMQTQSGWMSVCFGAMMGMLMCLGNGLYSLHPETLQEAFPVVRLLTAFGRRGFLISALMLYLSVFTTLCAVLYAFRCAVESCFQSNLLSALLVPGLPLLASCAGFEGIVDGLYAPAGLVCLCVVFAPLARRHLTQRR